MRIWLAAAVCVVGLASPAETFAQDTSAWTYAYSDGVATATERDDHGRVSATITCRPPTGNIVLADFTLARDGRRARTSAVRIGNLTINVPSRVDGRGQDEALRIDLPQRPPILAGMQRTDNITVTVDNHSRTMRDGSAMKMREVAYACWGS